MGAVDLGPEDAWPEHGKPWWRTALKKAREAGWSLHYIGAPHLYGQIRCPAGEHTATVDCTARGGETYAVAAETDVRECRHGTGGGPGSRVEERREAAAELLATAERLIDAARDGLDRIEANLDAFEELARLALLLDTAAATVAHVSDGDPVGASEPEEAEGIPDALAALQEAALERAIALDDAPEPDEVDEWLEEAAQKTATAADVVAKIRRQGLAKPLRDRADAARSEISILQVRLNRLRERRGRHDG